MGDQARLGEAGFIYQDSLCQCGCYLEMLFRVIESNWPKDRSTTLFFTGLFCFPILKYCRSKSKSCVNTALTNYTDSMSILGAV